MILVTSYATRGHNQVLRLREDASNHVVVTCVDLPISGAFVRDFSPGDTGFQYDWSGQTGSRLWRGVMPEMFETRESGPRQ